MRTVERLSQDEEENRLSRIYGGIHYPFDNEVGQRLGTKVAAYAFQNSPRFLDRHNADHSHDQGPRGRHGPRRQRK